MTLPCERCLQRSWVLASFAGYIERVRHRAGNVLAVLSLDDDELLGLLSGSGGAGALRRPRPPFDAVAMRDACARAGIAALCRHDERYPPALAGLPGAPAVLYCAGRPERLAELLAEPAAAVVGSRRASPEGLEVARALGRGLAAARVTVVSGMAQGVDAAAHAGALQAGAATVAVLPGGAERPYPAGKRPLYRDLVRRAAVLSEWPPGFAPRRWCFTARNRIVAGLARATIVIEAGARSGSLTTAAFALDFGRSLGAVPGCVLADGTAGSNALLFDGANAVRDARDALELSCGVEEARARRGPAQLEASPDRDAAAAIAPRLRRLLRDVEQGRIGQPSLLDPPGPGATPAADLARLELLGLIARGPGGRYFRTPRGGLGTAPDEG